ncbi:hypothetical protein SDC9_157878 [bioreactor metagenome]|uniref:Uncharacterized protein n=1 Tax=bioreactor metagenome TaxID=1076179 RepID=A0A645FDX3_9ZZZZ
MPVSFLKKTHIMLLYYKLNGGVDLNNNEKTQTTITPCIPPVFFKDNGDIDDFIFRGEPVKLCSER